MTDDNKLCLVGLVGGFVGTDPGDMAESKIVAETCVEIVRAFRSYELDTQAHFTLRLLRWRSWRCLAWTTKFALRG